MLLVLYSRRHNVWKLADFGFTSEAASRILRTSNDGKGTNGYRAPELLTGVYNNKVDIWSLGCILYELSVGQRAFNSDYATLQYKESGRTMKVILDEGFSDRCKETVTRNIVIMLQIDFSARPSATDLLEEFTRNFQSSQFQPQVVVQIDHIFHENCTTRSSGLNSLLQGNHNSYENCL